MSGQFALAVEEAKRFRQSLANVFEVLDYVSKMEHPEALDARIKSLRAESQNLIASYRKQAEDEAKKTAQADVDAAKLEAARIRKEAKEERTRLINSGQAEANRIVADARKAGEELTKKFEKAHQAAHAAIR